MIVNRISNKLRKLPNKRTPEVDPDILSTMSDEILTTSVTDNYTQNLDLFTYVDTSMKKHKEEFSNKDRTYY